MANAAIEMLSSLEQLSITMPPELGDTLWTKDVGDVQVRIGIHSGPVTAGVIGTQRMQYDVWGDTVNVASRMESTSEPGRIQVSEVFVRSLKARDDKLSVLSSEFSVLERGVIEVKGKDAMKTFWLESTSA